MKNAPFAEPLVSATTQDSEALAARKRLQTVLDQLNPAAGKVDPGNPKKNGKMKGGKKKARQKRENLDSQNANETDQ